MQALTAARGGLVAIFLLLAGTAAQAQDRVSVYQQQPLTYLTGSVGVATLKFTGFDVDSPILTVGMGGMANDYLGMEIRLGTSVMREDYKTSRYALDHVVSALGTLRVPLWRFIYGQAYAGVTNAQLMTIDPAGDKHRSNHGGLSYGASVGIRVIPRLHAAAGYTSYERNSYWKVQAVEGSLQYFF